MAICGVKCAMQAKPKVHMHQGWKGGKQQETIKVRDKKHPVQHLNAERAIWETDLWGG